MSADCSVARYPWKNRLFFLGRGQRQLEGHMGIYLFSSLIIFYNKILCEEDDPNQVKQ